MIWLILAVGLIFRLINLFSFPIFTDESIYLYWAKLLTVDWHSLFLPVWDGKTPLYIWLVAFFLKFGFDYLLVGRIISASAGVLTIIGVYFLSKALFDKKTAIIASFLYAVNPLALFYERLALMESLMNSLAFYSCLVLVIVFKKKSYKFSLIAGLLLGLTYLSKPSGAIFILGLLYLFVFAKNKDDFIFLVKNSFLSFLIFFPLTQIVRLSSAYFMMKMKTKEFVLSFQELWQNPFLLFFKNIKMVLIWLIEYQGLIALTIFLFSFLLLIFKSKSYQKVVFIFLYFITPLLIFSFIGKIIFPRYFLVIIPYFVTLISHLLSQKFEKFKLLTAIILGLMIIDWLRFDFNLIFNYPSLKLPQVERWQYLISSSSGYGLEKIYSFIELKLKNNNIIIVTDTAYGLFPYALELKYWEKKDKNIFFLPTWEFNKKFKKDLNDLNKKIKKPLTIFLFKEKKKSIIDKNLKKEFKLQFIFEVKGIDNKTHFLIYSSEI